MAAHAQTYADLARALLDEVVDATAPAPERARDVLAALEKEARNEARPVTLAVLASSNVGKALTKTAKACKRHRRTAAADEKPEWDAALSAAETLLAQFKAAATREAQRAAATKPAVEAATADGLPASAADYKTRLVRQKKEMYKDPPALPPQHVAIEASRAALPKRNKATGELTFVCGEDDAIREALRDFHPNRTPEEVLRAGAFGGTYFRPIASAVTNVRYASAAVLKDTVHPDWIAGLDRASLLTSSTYRKAANKFGVKCGGSLGMWESSGWIADSDPYGWFQWYCRFYAGRRCADDPRQISRWRKSAGLKGRFRSQLCNKIVAAGTTAGDVRISPVIRQTLLHWGLEVTEDVVEKHKRR